MQFFKTNEISPEKEPLLQNQSRNQAESSINSNIPASNATPASINSLDAPTLQHIASYLLPKETAKFGLTNKFISQSLRTTPIPNLLNKQGKAFIQDDIVLFHQQLKSNKTKLNEIEQHLDQAEAKMDKARLIAGTTATVAGLGCVTDVYLALNGTISVGACFGGFGGGLVLISVLAYFANKFGGKVEEEVINKSSEQVNLEKENDEISESLVGVSSYQMTK